MKNIPNKIKKIAKHFELLGKVEIEEVDKEFILTIRTGGKPFLKGNGYVDIESLFVLAKQYDIKKFYPSSNEKIIIILSV